MRRSYLLLILVVVGAITAAAYTLRVTQVRVTGLRTLAAADVIRTSGVEIGQRILWIRLSSAARHVETIPAVERATASRTLPGTVVIHITERRALAKLATTPDLVADTTGHVFEARGASVPILEGWRTTRSKHSLDAPSRAVLRAFERFPLALRRSTGKIVMRGSGLELDLRSGVVVRFGRLEDLDAKAAAALAVLRAEGRNKLAYVDVQVPTVPVVGPPPTPTPAPTLPPAPVPAVTYAPAPTAKP